MTVAERIVCWQELSIVLNEMNRSVGGSDAYPFSIGEGVTHKFEAVEEVILRLHRVDKLGSRSTADRILRSQSWRISIKYGWPSSKRQ